MILTVPEYSISYDQKESPVPVPKYCGCMPVTMKRLRLRSNLIFLIVIDPEK